MALVALGGYNMTAPPGPSCVMPLPMPPAGQRGRAERKRLMTSLKEARSLKDFCERVGRRAPKRKAEASLSDGQGALRQNKLAPQDLSDAPKRHSRLQQEQFRRREAMWKAKARLFSRRGGLGQNKLANQDRKGALKGNWHPQEELYRQSAETWKLIRKRRANRDPSTGRKLLSQSGEGPWLEVSDRPAPGGLTTLDCKARGFSTRNIALVWLRDGEPRLQETRQEEPLSSTDGTFETGAHIDIDPSPGDTYTCRVERPRLPGGLSKDWGGVGTTSNAPLISSVLTGGVLLGAAITGGVTYLLYRRHRRRHRRQAAGEPTTP